MNDAVFFSLAVCVSYVSHVIYVLQIFGENVFPLTPSPREPRAQAWGPRSTRTKSFRLERERLEINEKITDSFQILHLPIH